jgi:hypothetical protein
MATKKKVKKVMQFKRSSGKKIKAARRASKKKTPKKLTRQKEGGSSTKKVVGASKPTRQKATRRSSASKSAAFEVETGPRSAGQSGDLQGLRDIEAADSESVTELLEEGNAFEAGVVAGVEHVQDDEEREVHTHEVPEDDVPDEYQDKD